MLSYGVIMFLKSLEMKVDLSRESNVLKFDDLRNGLLYCLKSLNYGRLNYYVTLLPASTAIVRNSYFVHQICHKM